MSGFCRTLNSTYKVLKPSPYLSVYEEVFNFELYL